MVRVECLCVGSFEPGRRSLQQQRKESNLFIKQMGWTVVREIMETGSSKDYKMRQRSAIQSVIADAREGKFDVLLVWGIQCLSYEIDESAELMLLLEKAGVTVLLVNMERMAFKMGGDLQKCYTSPLEDVPKEYYEELARKAARMRRSMGKRFLPV